MAREPSIFHNLVTKENSTTELLCNLMRFTAFRRLVLEMFMSPEDAAEVEFDDIDTQCELNSKCGCPDLTVENKEISALIEVKVRKEQGCTQNQPDGYFRYLQKERADKKCYLVFLVPKKWIYREVTRKRLEALSASSKDQGIETSIIEWEEMLAVLEEHDLAALSPVLNEFKELLSARFHPKSVTFTIPETKMLYSRDTAEAISNLYSLVESVKNDPLYRTSRLSTKGGEYGFDFKSPQDKKVLWFGVWLDFWKREGFPLCFGFLNEWEQDVPELKTFRHIYNSQTIEFTDVNDHQWTMSWIPEEILKSENATERIRERLALFLDVFDGI